MNDYAQPLAAHNIFTLSPSSINLFVAERAQWCMKYLLKSSMPAGVGAMRGRVVEKAVTDALNGKGTPSGLARKALSAMQAEWSDDPDWGKEVEVVPQMAENGHDAVKKWGPPIAQGRTPTEIEGVRFIGYFDWVWPHDNLLIDLKCSHRLPDGGKCSPAHLRQVAIYRHATNYEVGICYVTGRKAEEKPKKNAPPPYLLLFPKQEEIDAAMAEVRTIIRSMAMFLALSDDPRKLTLSQYPNYESFYWSDPRARAVAEAIHASQKT